MIYYRYVPGDRIYLIYAYAKSERENLTPRQVKMLAALMEDETDG